MKNLFVAMFLALLCASTFANPSDICDGTVIHPCIIQDTFDATPNIKKFRTAPMLAQAYKGNTKGLKHMMVSASAVPSAGAFESIIKKINKTTLGKQKKIIDLDLRQESHVYLNGDAITLMDEANWVNKGKSHQQALADEQAWQQELATHSTIPNVLTAKQLKAKKYENGLTIDVKVIEPEQTLVEQLGFEYRRLTVTDHLRPSDSEVDTFVKLVRSTPKDVWIHLHCRGGDGRATTFFALLDMLRNADKVSFNDIIRRQAAVNPFYDLSDLHRKNEDMSKYYIERYEFLRQFYQFATDVLNGYQGSWSAWLVTGKH